VSTLAMEPYAAACPNADRLHLRPTRRH
jgi:hypothetical protein